jgi:hypothetical protein
MMSSPGTPRPTAPVATPLTDYLKVEPPTRYQQSVTYLDESGLKFHTPSAINPAASLALRGIGVLGF